MSQRMLNKIFAMAEKGDPGLQCAAIRILGELGLKDKKSVGLLSKKLSSEDIMIRS